MKKVKYVNSVKNQYKKVNRREKVVFERSTKKHGGQPEFEQEIQLKLSFQQNNN